MKIAIYKDQTIAIDAAGIATNLSRLVPNIETYIGKKNIAINGFFVMAPATYVRVKPQISRTATDCDLVFIFTEKPYDNNYFWESDNSVIIVSLAGWENLTTLSMNNGALYFICAIIIRHLNIGSSHQINTGCINDFWRDKKGIDVGMRSAYICPDCLKQSSRRLSKANTHLLEQLQAVLNELSNASRLNMDISEYWKLHSTPDDFDVFLCHNSAEKDIIRDMNARLKSHSIRTWFDEEQLPPGRLWQDELEKQIGQIRTAALFVGDSGVGPWQEMELRSFLEEFLRRSCPVIPVILPECKAVPQLPLFLRQLTWVDFRKKTPDPFKQLLWGITGKKP